MKLFQAITLTVEQAARSGNPELQTIADAAIKKHRELKPLETIDPAGLTIEILHDTKKTVPSQQAATYATRTPELTNKDYRVYGELKSTDKLIKAREVPQYTAELV